METTVNQRIVDLMFAKKLTKSKFCRGVNIPYQTIVNIIGDRQTKPSFEILEKILSAYEDINSDWLIRGKGEMFLSDNKTQTNKQPESRTSQVSEEIRATMENFYERQIAFLQEQLMAKDRIIEQMLGKGLVSSSTLLAGENLGAIAA